MVDWVVVVLCLHGYDKKKAVILAVFANHFGLLVERINTGGITALVMIVDGTNQ